MFFNFVNFNQHETNHAAYLATLAQVWTQPQYISAPRGLKVREILDYSFEVLHPKAEAVVTCDPARNEVLQRYTAAELALYRTCSRRVEDFGKLAKFWNGLSNPDGTVNSAYGWLIWADKSCGDPAMECAWHEPGRTDQSGRVKCMRTPWEWAREALKRDRDTRQAILKFAKRDTLWVGNKDHVCTQHGVFSIREGRLNLSMVMRSNDVVRGLVYDSVFFISLLEQMLAELKSTYPDLELGAYRHFSHSMHVYETDGDKVLKMLGR